MRPARPYVRGTERSSCATGPAVAPRAGSHFVSSLRPRRAPRNPPSAVRLCVSSSHDFMRQRMGSHSAGGTVAPYVTKSRPLLRRIVKHRRTRWIVQIERHATVFLGWIEKSIRSSSAFVHFDN